MGKHEDRSRRSRTHEEKERNATRSRSRSPNTQEYIGKRIRSALTSPKDKRHNSSERSSHHSSRRKMKQQSRSSTRSSSREKSADKAGKSQEKYRHQHRASHSLSEDSEREKNKSRKHRKRCHSQKSDSDSVARSKHLKKKNGKHKHKRKSSSPESASSDDSSSSLKLLQKLEQERSKQQENMKMDKELMKALETPEEKRMRRLLKKELKERKRKERMGWDNDYLHYTNTDNPFGDANLLATFVWGKKMDKEGLSNVSTDELERRNRMKQEENKRELEKVKKRRQEREMERQQREEEMALMQREKEAAQFQEWECQEDQFHLEQARLRSKIRIQDGRAKPIDLLAKYVSAEEDVDAVEMHEPYTYLNGLVIKDLEDLIEDIKVYKELEKGKNFDYWSDITVIVEYELNKLRKLDRQSVYEAAVDRREGINISVARDVTSVFWDKTSSQLLALEKSIQSKINNKTEGLDVSYWESLLFQLKAHIARARLRDRHQENLRRKLEMLKAEQGVLNAEAAESHQCSRIQEVGEVQETTMRHSGIWQAEEKVLEGCLEQRDVLQEELVIKQELEDADDGSQELEPSEEEEDNDEDENDEDKDGNESQGNTVAQDMISKSITDYEAGSYSPQFLRTSDLEPGTLIVSELDDVQRLAFARELVLGTGQKVENVLTAEEKAMQREARKGMDDDEAVFSVEENVDKQVYLWSDKYRPRKPRYFNRVHTGFEWNKYNQTHYDMDNPPPKIVQGYKFNIFYPDLIDKNSTPEYFLTPCNDNKDFATLRFHAGPPYEDIAFKIVNREWEYSYKRGFRCQFHNNIFQLWFHFKRYRYRR